MERYTAKLIADLRTLIQDLGKDGGIMSPSIYDTAQILRLYPPEEGVVPALKWLLAQQQADGGWGNIHIPYARDIPTLATLLTLHTYSDVNDTGELGAEKLNIEEAISSGLTFLDTQVKRWKAPLPEDIPVAAEVVVPYLLEEAKKMGLNVPQEGYCELVKLGQKKRQMIEKLQPSAGTPPTFSWEAWGENAHRDVLDAIGSVGHNPTATVAWLLSLDGENGEEQADATCAVKQYLRHAGESTQSGIPGVYPTAWPINRFEQSYALYWLLCADLLDHQLLQDVVRPQLDDLERAMSPKGLAFSDYFTPDGDDTAAGVAVLQAAGRSPSTTILAHFEHDQHFSTYPYELQFSLTVTARSVHAFGIQDVDTSGWQKFLADCQKPNGSWIGDKWNTSWLYTTCHVLLALRGSSYVQSMQAAYYALVENQYHDGGWGTGDESNMTETAYGIMAMYALMREGFNDSTASVVLMRSHRRLLEQYLTHKDANDMCWLNKELYRPHRVDQAFILSALLCVLNLDNMQEVEKQIEMI